MQMNHNYFSEYVNLLRFYQSSLRQKEFFRSQFYFKRIMHCQYKILDAFHFEQHHMHKKKKIKKKDKNIAKMEKVIFVLKQIWKGNWFLLNINEEIETNDFILLQTFLEDKFYSKKNHGFASAFTSTTQNYQKFIETPQKKIQFITNHFLPFLQERLGLDQLVSILKKNFDKKNIRGEFSNFIEVCNNKIRILNYRQQLKEIFNDSQIISYQSEFECLMIRKFDLKIEKYFDSF